MSIDTAGNKIETISNAITVEKAPTVADLTQNNYVNYVASNGNTIKCAVLWPADSTYGKNGVQIIAMNVIEQVKFGQGNRLESNGRCL